MDKVKVYVEVTARFTNDGKLFPESITWENGRRYEIDRIKKCERCASRKAGGAGLLYTCIISHHVEASFQLRCIYYDKYHIRISRDYIIPCYNLLV